jgi:NhaP-type Na+/H+ or K+/H+ antiporter
MTGGVKHLEGAHTGHVKHLEGRRAIVLYCCALALRPVATALLVAQSSLDEDEELLERARRLPPRLERVPRPAVGPRGVLSAA